MSIIEVNHVQKKYAVGERQPYLSLAAQMAGAVTFFGKKDKEGTKAEQEFWALQDINFSVEQGEVIGIIGRNGAGKSTLLKILSQITPPTSGEIRLKGRVGSLLEVGTGFHQELTGRENIFLNGSILGMRKKEIEKKFDQIVEFADIKDFLDVPVKRYSSGMQVRLAFSVAAHLEPEILIVDEVLAVGDLEFQKKCLGKMDEVTRGQGRTVILVSHNMETIESLCSKCLYLENGRVKMFDKTELVIEAYLSSFSKSSQVSEWVNSGNECENDWFKPLSFCISRAQSNKTTGNDTTETWVSITGEVRQDNPALMVGYELYNDRGTFLYSSFFVNEEERKVSRVKRGIFSFRSKLPADVLRGGIYKISLSVGIQKIDGLFSSNKINNPTIYYEVPDRGIITPYWLEQAHELVQPVIDWDFFQK